MHHRVETENIAAHSHKNLPFSPIRRFGMATALLLTLLVVIGAMIANASNTQAFDFKLIGSEITASPQQLASGSTSTVTVILRNDADTADSLDVTVVHPSELTYVSGSGGSYDSTNRAVSWTGISVPARGEVSRTFQLRFDGSVSSSTSVVIVGAISGREEHITRLTTIELIPGGSATTPTPTPPTPTPTPPTTTPTPPTTTPTPPTPTPTPPTPTPTPPGGPRLFGSYLFSSDFVLTPGDTTTFTLMLYNNGTGAASVDVENPIPADLKYVDGSASHGGVYNDSDRTLRWSSIDVGAGEIVRLSYDAEPELPIILPKIVWNSATINTATNTFVRSTAIVLLPIGGLDVSDMFPPVVDSFVIDPGDVLTNRNVTLQIDARDDTSVDSMYFREWHLDTNGSLPRWTLVQSSAWMPFSASHSWELGPQAGVHHIGVWLKDPSGNVSLLTPSAIDRTNLLVSPTAIDQGKVHLYQVNYPAGVDVTADLTTLSGDADLYVWYPGSFGNPDLGSFNDGTEPDSVSFTTSRAGVHVIAVIGFRASSYNLDLTPSPNSAMTTTADVQASVAIADNAQQLATKGDKSTPNLEDLLADSGLDPIANDVAESPPASFNNTVYLPIVIGR